MMDDHINNRVTWIGQELNATGKFSEAEILAELNKLRTEDAKRALRDSGSDGEDNYEIQAPHEEHDHKISKKAAKADQGAFCKYVPKFAKGLGGYVAPGMGDFAEMGAEFAMGHLGGCEYPDSD